MCPSVATCLSTDCWFSELCMLVLYKAGFIIISLKNNLFSSWYSWSRRYATNAHALTFSPRNMWPWPKWQGQISMETNVPSVCNIYPIKKSFSWWNQIYQEFIIFRGIPVFVNSRIPGWLNELGSWITYQFIQAYHQYGVGSRPAL